MLVTHLKGWFCTHYSFLDHCLGYQEPVTKKRNEREQNRKIAMRTTAQYVFSSWEFHNWFQETSFFWSLMPQSVALITQILLGSVWQITSVFPLISYPHDPCTKHPQTASLSCIMAPLQKCFSKHCDSGGGSLLFSVTLCYMNHMYDNRKWCQSALTIAAQSQVMWWIDIFKK